MRHYEHPVDRRWLFELRRKRGLTQAQVAKSVGITTAYYNRIEFGVYTPRVDIAFRISRAIGFDYNLWDGEQIID